MHAITTSFRRAIALAAILATVLAALPLAVSAQDTSGDKELCKNDGWQELTRADGTSFTNQGECVKYVVSEGGTFEDSDDTTETPPDEGETGIQLHVVSSVEYGDACVYTLYLTGLTPESGSFELWKQFAGGPAEIVPFANGWNGFGINISSTQGAVPATFTVNAQGSGDLIDSVTIATCGDSA